MLVRQFEGEDHAALYRQYRETPPESLIQRIILYLQEEYKEPLTQAVDLGCGSGQCSFLLSKYFKNVLAKDISESQIQEGIKEQALRNENNVTFSVSPAETIELPDKSVQLIIACTAAHWFDLPKLYEEGRRVLVPGGVMVFICVQSRVLELGENVEKNKKLLEIGDGIEGFLRQYYAPPVELWYNKYTDITIPYRNLIRELGHGLEISYEISLSKILGATRSLSGFQNFLKKSPDEAEKWVENLKQKCMAVAEIAEKDLDKPIFTARYPYMMVMSRL